MNSRVIEHFTFPISNLERPLIDEGRRRPALFAVWGVDRAFAGEREAAGLVEASGGVVARQDGRFEAVRVRRLARADGMGDEAPADAAPLRGGVNV